jgi:hypothetical protein
MLIPIPNFPTNEKEGVTLRDLFAFLLLHAVVTHGVSNDKSNDEIAYECYKMADAMMKEREPKQ